MSATAIDSLLVEIGFDVNSDGAKDAESMMSSLSKKALILGASLAAIKGVEKLASVASEFAKVNDQLSKFSDLRNIGGEYIQKLDYALVAEGGNEGDAFGAIERAQDNIAKARLGDVGFLEDLAKLRFNPKALKGITNVEQYFAAIEKQFGNMGDQQIIQAAKVLGLSDAETLMLKRKSYAKHAKEAEKRGLIPDTYGDLGEEFVGELQELEATWNGIVIRWKSLLLRIGIPLMEGLDFLLLKFNELNSWIFDFFESGEFTSSVKEFASSFMKAFNLGAELMESVVERIKTFFTDKVNSLLGIEEVQEAKKTIQKYVPEIPAQESSHKINYDPYTIHAEKVYKAKESAGTSVKSAEQLKYETQQQQVTQEFKSSQKVVKQEINIQVDTNLNDFDKRVASVVANELSNAVRLHSSKLGGKAN